LKQQPVRTGVLGKIHRGALIVVLIVSGALAFLGLIFTEVSPFLVVGFTTAIYALGKFIWKLRVHAFPAKG
jgi:hypothetical protein